MTLFEQRDVFVAERRMFELLALGSIPPRLRAINYAPNLSVQLEIHSDKVRIVTVRANGRFVPSVNPHTREAESDAQQFAMSVDGKLRPLPRSLWTRNPDIVDVGEVRYS